MCELKYPARMHKCGHITHDDLPEVVEINNCNLCGVIQKESYDEVPTNQVDSPCCECMGLYKLIDGEWRLPHGTDD